MLTHIVDFNYLLPNGRSLTTGKLRGKWTTSVSVRSSISYIDNRLVKAGLCLHLIHTLILVVESNFEMNSGFEKNTYKTVQEDWVYLLTTTFNINRLWANFMRKTCFHCQMETNEMRSSITGR